MNTTERVIVEQFPLWTSAPVPPALPGTGANYVIVGCGTSFHLAQSVAASFNLKGFRAQAVPGGEWSRRRRAYQPDGVPTQVIALSRSGESTETIQALERSRAAGFGTLALTCEAGSGVTRAAERSLYVPTHPSEGIVMTASASLLLMTCLRAAGVEVGPAEVEAARTLMTEADRALAGRLGGRSHVVFLGAGPLYGLAAEGSIKLQEMSLSFAQVYHTMEYRHGPISLVDDRTLAILLYSDATRDEEARVAAEISQKGGLVVGIGGPGDVALAAGGNPEARALVALPALQILGERIAGLKGIDTAAPRHLNKVVVLG